jgi:tetratricopeptide (TPR) repeat protein
MRSNILFLIIFFFSVGTQAQSQRKVIKNAISAGLNKDFGGMKEWILQADSSVKWQSDFHALSTWNHLNNFNLSQVDQHVNAVKPEKFKWFPNDVWDSLSQVYKERQIKLDSIKTELKKTDQLSRKDLKAMESVLNKVDTSNYPIFACKGLLALKSNNYASSFEALNEAKKRNFDSPVLPYLMGLAAFNGANYQAAIRCFRESLDNNTALDSSFYYLGESYFITRQYDSALVYIEQFPVTGYWKLNRKGMSYRMLKQHKQALTAFSAATLFNQNSPEAWLNEIEQQEILGNDKQAEQLLNVKLKEFPEEPVFLDKAMNIALEQNDCQEVLRLMDLIELNGGYDQTRAVTKMKVHFTCKNFQEAQKQLHLIPRYSLIDKKVWEARIFVGLDQLEKAEKVLDETISKGTVIASVYAYNAAIKRKLNKPYEKPYTQAMVYGWSSEIPSLP